MIDVPKDVQFANGTYVGKDGVHKPTYSPRIQPQPEAIAAAADLDYAGRSARSSTRAAA
ncbi:MAG: hypothetical protein R3C00_03560 [Hyphomonas sp.]